jgi:hypothetical protein
MEQGAILAADFPDGKCFPRYFRACGRAGEMGRAAAIRRHVPHPDPAPAGWDW